MNRSLSLAALAVMPIATFLLGGCSGSGSDGSGGDFLMLRTAPPNNGKLFLNDPIAIDFTQPIDLSTADLNTVAFQVFDAGGNALAEQPAGSFQLARSPGDTQIGRRLAFVPRFPSNNTYTNGGFRPGRTYLVQLVGGSRRNNNVLKDMNGKGLSVPVSFQLTTADGTTPSELFRDTKVGGPRRVGFSVTPGPASAAGLNQGGQVLTQIVLQFDQPLNPAASNVPVNLTADPSGRSIGSRGRVFLEYDDPDPLRGAATWIPAVVDLASNQLTGSELHIYPVGVLPNNATIRVIVENTLEDMSGESNVSDASYDRVFATFDTRADYQPQFDAIVDQFDDISQIDAAAPFLEPVAEFNRGYIRAAFDFQGATTVLDYEPKSKEVFLNTNFTQVAPKNAPPINISGGVFEFRNVNILPGVTVKGTGTNPMMWLVTVR